MGAHRRGELGECVGVARLSLPPRSPRHLHETESAKLIADARPQIGFGGSVEKDCREAQDCELELEISSDEISSARLGVCEEPSAQPSERRLPLPRERRTAVDEQTRASRDERHAAEDAEKVEEGTA
jgi:hypothetical protein